MNFFEFGDTVVGIQLCGRQAGMSQEFLDRIQIGPPVQQVRRKSMPENVRALFLLGGHQTKILINNAINKRFINFRSPLRQKQKRDGSGRGQLGSLYNIFP